jgi:hypothetical protein
MDEESNQELRDRMQEHVRRSVERERAAARPTTPPSMTDDKLMRELQPFVFDTKAMLLAMAKGEQAKRDALSAIIERHTTDVRQAVDKLNRSSQKTADDMRRLTRIIALLTAIIAVAAVATVIAALH